MIKIMIAIILVFCFSLISVHAQDIYGGETITYDINKCDWLVVNITPSDLHEWNAFPNCTEETAGNFHCICNNDYILSLYPMLDSVGDFRISITNYWLGGEISYPVYYGGMTREIIYKNLTNNVTVTKEVPVYINRTITIYNTSTVNNTIEVPIEKIVYKYPYGVLACIIIVCIISLGKMYFYFKRKIGGLNGHGRKRNG